MGFKDGLEKIFHKIVPPSKRVVKDKKGNFLGYLDKKGNLVDKKGNLIGSFAMKEKVVDKNGEEIIKVKYISTDGKYEGNDSEEKIYRNGKLYGDYSKQKHHKDKIKGSSRPFIILTILLIVLFIFGSVVYDTLENEVPVITITDEVGSWEQQEKVDVFDEKICPGSQGEYKFVIDNESIQKIEYRINIKHFYNNEEVEYFPLVYRLKKEFKYLTGINWVQASELNFDELLLTGGKDQNFVLEWKWPYEGESDELDTLLGYSQGTYYITIDVKAEIYNGK